MFWLHPSSEAPVPRLIYFFGLFIRNFQVSHIGLPRQFAKGQRRDNALAIEALTQINLVQLRKAVVFSASMQQRQMQQKLHPSALSLFYWLHLFL